MTGDAIDAFVVFLISASVKTKVDFRPPAEPALRPYQNVRPLARTEGRTSGKLPDGGTIFGHPAKFEALRMKI